MFKVKEYKEPTEDQGKMVWTTKKVNQLLDAMEEGYQPAEHPFYEGDPNYKKGNIVFEHTDLEYEELKRCAKDIIYFANTYCQVMTDEGYQKIKLRDYQERVLRSYQTNRWNIFLAARQVGKTITSSIFLTWFLVFHYDKNVLLMSNKGATTKEIMDKIKAIMEGLPFFLKPGCNKKDVMTMVFDNKCRIIGQNTTKTGGIGFTIHLLFLDEFAHIPENIKKPFYENVYPTLSSSKISRVIITSTPNKFDLFHQLYEGAVNGDNEYTASRVDWWEVPGRDEAWKMREIANLGSEEAFNEQYGCQFLQSSSLLLNSEQILRLEKNKKEFVFREIDELDDLCLDYSQLKWDPNFDIDEIKFHQEQEMRSSLFSNTETVKRNFYTFTIDLAEGVGRDFSVINIYKLNVIPRTDMERLSSPGSIAEFFGLEQVGIFRSNLHNMEDFSKIMYCLCVKVFDQENLSIILEYNTYGAELIKNLLTLYPSTNDFNEESILKFKHRATSKNKSYGIRLNRDNKIQFCESTKKFIDSGRIIIKDAKTIDEAKFFSRNPSGTYSAQTGHDDCFMTVVTASAFFDSLEYAEIVEEFFDYIDSDLQGLIDDTIESFDKRTESDLYDSIF